MCVTGFQLYQFKVSWKTDKHSDVGLNVYVIGSQLNKFRSEMENSQAFQNIECPRGQLKLERCDIIISILVTRYGDHLSPLDNGIVHT